MTLAMWVGIIVAAILVLLMFAISAGLILRRASDDLERVVREMREAGRTEPTRRK